MLKRFLIVWTVWISWFASGLDILEPPPDLVWMKESEPGQVSCQSKQPWQWCYWELVPVEGSANLTAKTKRFQTYQVRFLFG